MAMLLPELPTKPEEVQRLFNEMERIDPLTYACMMQVQMGHVSHNTALLQLALYHRRQIAELERQLEDMITNSLPVPLLIIQDR